MKTTHYSREGYNGDYTYTSVCGKTVRTHQEDEDSSIHISKTNCPDCLSSQLYNIDKQANEGDISDIKRRIYIESDILQADEFTSAQRDVYEYCKSLGLDVVDRVFSDVLDFAWHDLDKTWEAVKKADEIYATSSLMPLVGNSYMGAPVIFNGMCEKAIKEGVSGKKVIIFNQLRSIHWDMIDVPLMKKAFTNNELIMYNEDYELTPIDVKSINP